MKIFKRSFVLLLAAIILCSIPGFSAAAFEADAVPVNYEGIFAPGRVIVGLNDNAGASVSSFSSAVTATSMFPGVDVIGAKDLTDVSQIMAENGVTENRAASAQSSSFVGGGSILLLELAENTEQAVLDAIEVLMENPNVAYAEPDLIGFADKSQSVLDYGYIEEGVWGLDKIQVPDAWEEYTTGSHSVMVGVLDTGVDYTHPDLAGNVDAGLGYNFNWDDPDPIDMPYDGHGTHVAGIIGAKGYGVNVDVTIVPLKIWDYDWGYVSQFITAMYYAESIGLPIANISGGWYSWWFDDFYVEMQAMEAAVENFSGLLVTTAGNDSNDNDAYPGDVRYPAALDCGNIIVVAATDEYDDLAWFSSYGETTVDLAAPGVGILSTVSYYNYWLDGYYDYYDGTSMAAPHVTGAAALLKAYAPELTTQEIKDAILNSVDYLPSLDGMVATNGRLNVYRALWSVEPDIDVINPIGPDLFYVDKRTGNLIMPDGSYSYTRPVYNHYAPNRWRLSVDERLDFSDEKGYYTDNLGNRHPLRASLYNDEWDFERDQSNPAVVTELYGNPLGTWEMVYQDGTVKYFGADGWLISCDGFDYSYYYYPLPYSYTITRDLLGRAVEVSYSGGYTEEFEYTGVSTIPDGYLSPGVADPNDGVLLGLPYFETDKPLYVQYYDNHPKRPVKEIGYDYMSGYQLLGYYDYYWLQ